MKAELGIGLTGTRHAGDLTVFRRWAASYRIGATASARGARQGVMRMKHPSVCELFDYWTEQRGRRAMPERADIEPAAIRRALADTFILSFEPAMGHPFRVAGTRVCALFGREIKGEGFLHLFSHAARRELRALIAIVAEESVGVVASASELSVTRR